ncbi:MAG: four helix bundle protein [Cyclobacteriaceae bacterium]|jgi:four helix bundle protein
MLKKTSSFKELLVWQKAHELVLTTYLFTKRLPHDEIEGLIKDIRMTSAAIASRIAEGHQSANPGRTIQYLCHGQESLNRLAYLLVLCEDLDYGSSDQINDLIEELSDLISNAIGKTKHNLTLDFA